MAYAPQQRPYYDADSHIMELPDFLKAYADPEIRDEIPSVSYSASVVTEDEVAVIMDQGGKHSAEHVAAQIAMGDALIENSKEIQALGAFNGPDRSAALVEIFPRRLRRPLRADSRGGSPGTVITGIDRTSALPRGTGSGPEKWPRLVILPSNMASGRNLRRKNEN